MFAVIKIRSFMNADRGVEDTMRMMRLKSSNQCVLLPETPDVKGMLHKCKDFITWGEISKETLAKMLSVRLHESGGEKKVDAKMLKAATGFDSFDSLADSIISGKSRIKEHEKLHPVFRLTPPPKGFKSVRDHFPRGDLGYRGKEINELIERMI